MFKIMTPQGEEIGEVEDILAALQFCIDNEDPDAKFYILTPDGQVYHRIVVPPTPEPEPEPEAEKTKGVTLDPEVSCQRCYSLRVVDMGGKTSDLCNTTIGDAESDGYVPSDMGVGGGDYIEITFCLDCGQLQGTWPVPLTELELGEDDEDEDEDD